MAITTTDGALLRLLHLCSANLPVGAYAYSQGLEAAVELGWVSDVATLEDWLDVQLRSGLGSVDIPLLLRLHEALDAADVARMDHWNALALACRESGELRMADIATGTALRRLMGQLELPAMCREPEISFLTAFAEAAHGWRIAPRVSAGGFLWSWLENQVIAATKLMPLGQAEAHRLMARLQPGLEGIVECAARCPDEAIGGSLPALAIASGHHETQYTRLFRS